jgi:hypothetical protein
MTIATQIIEEASDINDALDRAFNSTNNEDNKGSVVDGVLHFVFEDGSALIIEDEFFSAHTVH